MKIRSLAAALLAVLLLCGTSWVSVCDLTCQLGRMQPTGGASAMKDSAMPCDHCHGAKAAGDSAREPSPCSPLDCGQMVVVAELGNEDASIQIADLHGAVIDEVSPVIMALVPEALRLIRPQLGGSAFRPLFISLRV